MSGKDWQKLLKTNRLNPVIHRFSSVDSTNDVIKDFLQDSSEQNPVVIALQQTQGKGRLDRKWISPIGGLYLSVAIDLRIPAENSPLLVLLVGSACVSSIRNLTAIDAGLKWPNDILVSDRKVGGILCELVLDSKGNYYVIAGIGINVNTNMAELPPDVQKISTNLESTLSIHKLAVHILNGIDSRLITIEGESGIDCILKEWENLSLTIGRRILVNLGNSTIHGTALGVTEDGALIVKETNGTQTIVDVGDVEHLHQTDTYY
ncbi:MAG: biotin--[acetyl-CoA-carboxylase] ligase [Candidatus Lokiarchaeota archaeon]|nr:biotin--[acetyl-CoA-carboxylase] ligase [Candidatus Lokiarchaeota archaeon]